MEERYADTISGEELYTFTNEYGDTFYYKDKAMAIYHRLDGPAIEGASGYKAWLVDGKRHRTDGPAIEDPNGPKWWYVNDRCHRLDGPAMVDAGKTKSWYVDGVFIMKLNKKGKIIDRMK